MQNFLPSFNKANLNLKKWNFLCYLALAFSIYCLGRWSYFYYLAVKLPNYNWLAFTPFILTTLLAVFVIGARPKEIKTTIALIVAMILASFYGSLIYHVTPFQKNLALQISGHQYQSVKAYFTDANNKDRLCPKTTLDTKTYCFLEFLERKFKYDAPTVPQYNYLLGIANQFLLEDTKSRISQLPIDADTNLQITTYFKNLKQTARYNQLLIDTIDKVEYPLTKKMLFVEPLLYLKYSYFKNYTQVLNSIENTQKKHPEITNEFDEEYTGHIARLRRIEVIWKDDLNYIRGDPNVKDN